jgi:hypothetical protein
MASNNGVFGQKIVTSAQVDVANIKFPELSDETRHIIRAFNLKSLEGLIGENWESIAHQLAEGYWKRH